MSKNGQNVIELPGKAAQGKTIRGDTRIAKIRRARVWALVRLEGMTPAEAYRKVLPGGRADDIEAQGQAMVETFEAEAGDNLEAALTAADLGVARLLCEIDASLRSATATERTAALRLLADLHKRPTITAPPVTPITVERGIVVTPSELSPDDWSKANRSPK